MKCCKCSEEFDEKLGICPFCGTEISNCATAEEVESYKLVNDSTVETPKRKKMAWTLVAAVSLPVLCALFIGVYFFISSVISSDAKTYSENEISEICDILDYSGITATVDYYSESIEEAYVCDADNDGRKELFMLGYNALYELKPVVFAFDTMDSGIMATAVQNGAAGSTAIDYTDDNGLSLVWGYYTIGTTEVHYEKWTDTGWQEFANYPVETADMPDSIGRTSHHCLMSNYYVAKNPEDIVNAYDRHLTNEFGSNYRYVKQDLDGDGKDEYAFIIAGLGELWANNLTTTGTDGELMEDFIDSLEELGLTVIYADTDKSGIIFHTFFTEKTVSTWCDKNGADNVRLSWHDGELLVKLIDGQKIETESFFCSEVKLSKENYESDGNAFYKVSELYTKYLKNHLYKDVLVKYVDICDAPGDELICICTDSDIDRVNVYAVYCGRIITLYEQDYSKTGAVYLTEKDGKMMLLNYTQRVYGNQLFSAGNHNKRRGNDYRYWFTGFDENYYAYEQGVKYLLVYDDEIPTSDDNLFFAELNEYLDIAIVCVDRYELTGYSVMPNIESDYSQIETGKYLSISNCNLNKKGRVSVDENSCLNFREGPDITYNKILYHSSDSESFVKQMNGSSVTVIDTENTGDAENPIWVKIQIKYSDKTLIGYSSQKYIEIADIKHIAIGEIFTIEANTNDNGLHWSSNNDDILSVDSSTGKVTGKNKGLVLVSVESESGLTDSCLIMVD